MPRLLASVLSLAAVAGSLLLIPATDAVAAPAITVTPSTVVAGGTVTVSGTGCWEAGLSDVPDRPWTVQVHVPPSTVGTVATTSGPAGAWSLTLRLPASHPGGAIVTATCALSSTTFFSYQGAHLTVTPLTPPPVPPPAPAPAPAPTLASKATATRPPSPSATPSPTRTPTPSAPSPTAPIQSTAAPATGVAAPGCSDCARVIPGAPLEAGERLRLSYTGFQPGELITVVMRSAPVTLGTFTADTAGTVTAEVELPGDAEAGAHTLTFSGPLSGDFVVLPLRIEAAEQAAAPTAAPVAEIASDDGSAMPWLVGGGLVALMAGAAGGVMLHRRRRPQATVTPIAEPIT